MIFDRTATIAAASAAASATPSGAASNLANGLADSAGEAERALQFQAHLKDQILDKGLMGWAKEQWVEKLKAQLRKEVMADMDLTDAQLTSMEETLRRTIEQMIQQQIEKKMQQAMGAGQPGSPGGAAGDQPQKPTGVAAGGIGGKPTLSLPALTLAQGWAG